MMPEMTPEKQPENVTEMIPEVVPEAIPEPPPALIPPAPPKSRWQRLLHWEYFGLSIIILVTLIFHFTAIMRPNSIVWDEVWYVGDARSIFSGTGDMRPEHPPLAKLYIVAGDIIFNGFKAPTHDTGVKIAYYTGNSESNDNVIVVTDASQFQTGQTIRVGTEQMDINKVDLVNNELTVKRGAGGSPISTHAAQDSIFIFTDNAFGWRFFSVIFGTISIILCYFICRKLKLSWKTAMIATFLFAFENMTFLHSGLALLDVYMVTFMLAAVLMYLDEKYLLMGLFVALSAECKVVGALILIAIFLHWAIYRKDKWKEFAAGLVVAAVAFVVLFIVFDFFIVGSFENPVIRIQTMLSDAAANVFTIPKLSISSRPWAWIYPQFWDPNYNAPFIVYSFDPQYISFVSTTVQLMTLPVIGWMSYKIYKNFKQNQVAGFIVLWFIATYLIWIPLDIVTNRATYVFYFLSTTPAICIGLSIAISNWMEHLKNRRLALKRTTPLQITGYVVIATWLLIHLAIFVIFNPAIPVIIKTWLPPFT